MRILVIGAGIGGLAAAHALNREGHDVTVVERAPELRTSGAALTLWSNGTGVLADLGIATDGLGAPVDALEQRTFDSRVLLRLDIARAEERYGHPNISMPRRNLVRRLASALPEGTVVFGRQVTSVEQDADKAPAVLADGSTAEADLVIGADGYRSVVRKHVWGSDPLQPSGWATWQGLSRITLETTTSMCGLMILGPEGFCGLMPAGDGLLQWWFDLRQTPDEPRPDSPVAMLRKRFGHWSSPVDALLDAVTDEDVEYFAHYGHKIPRVWSKGRVTVLGDAAHTMPPTVAQGGNQALEDAWALAQALRKTPGDLAAALADYERSRARPAAYAARLAGSEMTDRYLPTFYRMTPDRLMSRYYTYFLRRVSTFLTTQASKENAGLRSS
ncbi:NAD(P)/FAD-dependent oxidoreductase [Catenulispora subtropica]|uniref:FAD-dependent urate hydroxylase HpxO n=1 Tax=Catenulispora subtropica TaxID=450798 RepID=A0ABP5DVG0_9ACTN